MLFCGLLIAALIAAFDVPHNAGLGYCIVILLCRYPLLNYSLTSLVLLILVAVLRFRCFSLFAVLFHDSPYLCLFSRCSYIASFAYSWGPICWVIPSEIYPLRLRGKASEPCAFNCFAVAEPVYSYIHLFRFYRAVR